MTLCMCHVTSDDPVGRHPVFAGREDTNGSKKFFVRDINVLVDDRGIKVVAVQSLDFVGLLRTPHEIIVL